MYKTALPYCSFVEKTPFMGVELLDLLENYNCVSYNRDSASKSLIKRGFKIIPYQDKKIIKPIDSDRAVIEILKNKKFVKNNIKLDDTGGLLLFYMDSEINDLVKENDLNLLLPQYNLQQLLGDKLQVSFLTEQLNLPAYKSLNYSSTSKNQKKDFVACAENLGLSFIVQGEQGVSGEDTRLIHEEDEFINFSKKNKRFKASYYVKKSISISMQICITSNELIIRGPFPQILGFKELSSNLYQYSGGDLNQQIISKKIIEDAIEYSKK